MQATSLQDRAKQLSLKVKFFLGSLFYLTYAPYAYRYSRYRDKLEQQFNPPPPSPSEVMENPGKLVRAELRDRGADFYFEQAELEAVFLAPDFVRLTWKPGLLPVPYAIVKPESEWTPVEVNLEETGEGWTLTSSGLRIVATSEGQLRFYDAAGQLVRQELPPRREGESWKHSIALREEENVYGLGERAAPLNVRAAARRADANGEKTYRMWNYDAAGMYGPGSDPMYISIPIALHLHHQGCYLAFYENSFEAAFTFKDDRLTPSFDGGALRYYVAAGTPAQVMERYTELTGRSPLPPVWALGYHQSRWGYRTEAAIRETVRQFEERNLPLSAVHMDIDVQVGYRAFTIDPDRFPRLGEFTKELINEAGVRFITILNPGIKYARESKPFVEGRMLDAFCKYPNGELAIAPVWCGWSVFPDFTDPLVRTWWSRQYEFMLDLGVAGFWHDMNEPAAFIAWGDRSLPKVTRHKMEGRGGDHREAHNVYGFLQAQAGYESLSQYRPHQRPFIVSRAGWAGLQRYAWTWTGDVECTWESMHQTIPTVLGLGLSGIPYSGPDIGGFQGNPSAELYLRWFQMSTFMPFYRSHNSNNVEYRTPWTYGEPYLSIIRSFLQLRYRLMPYLYSLAWESSQKGYPLLRPLFWAATDQPELWSVDDQFLLGNSLMVCPVLEEGARSRLVSLPRGRWYSFWDDRALEGPAQLELEAPLERLPLLVKAGTILPTNEGEHLVLHLYPPVEGSCEVTLYDDLGDDYGESRVDRLRLVRLEEGLELFWERTGNYPFSSRSIQIHLHGFKPQQAWVSGQAVDRAEPDRRFHYEVMELFEQAFFKGEYTV